MHSVLVTPSVSFDLTTLGSFPFVPPQYVMRPPVTEHVPLHSKSLCINICTCIWGCKQYVPGGGGGGAQTEKISTLVVGQHSLEGPQTTNNLEPPSPS